MLASVNACRGWQSLALMLSTLACARGDVSGYLRGGACNAEGQCAPGYECNQERQCVQRPDAQPPVSDSGPAGPSDGPAAPGAEDGGAVEAHVDGGPTPVCEDGKIRCSGQCVDTRNDPAHCGSCASTCLAAGSNLACGNYRPGTCDCAGNDALCGAPGTFPRCDATTGLCACSGQTCVPGEICRTDSGGTSVCSCDGVQTCGSGWTCCQGAGCVSLLNRADHCGACGNACPNQQFLCQGGLCLCRNNKACQGGGAGTCNANGRCQCDGVVCNTGEVCVADGVCG